MMNLYNSLITMLKAERFKTRKNTGLLLMLLVPIFLTICVDIYLGYNYFMNLGNSEIFAYNPWTVLLGRYLFSFYAFVYPLIVAVFCYSYCDMEYKNDNLKQLFTLPIDKRIIFSAKVILIFRVVFLSVFFAYMLFLLSGFCMSYIFPRYCFQDYDIRLITLILFFKFFLGLFTISIIQYYISTIFKNFVVPVGISCFGVVVCLVMQGWEYIKFVPYNSIIKAYYGFCSGVNTPFDQVEYINICYLIIGICASYYAFTKLKV